VGGRTIRFALILGGEKAGDIKLPPSGFATPRFYWREMQRWGISAEKLLTNALYCQPTCGYDLKSNIQVSMIGI
jgi:hypothetical protein